MITPPALAPLDLARPDPADLAAPALAPAVAAPLRAIDRVRVSTDLRGGLVVRAIKTVTAADRYLSGHFPAGTVYPGVFTLESVCQAVTAAVGTRAGRAASLHLLHSARFVSPLLAGDELVVQARISPIQDGTAFEVDARCLRSPGVACARIRARFAWGPADGS